MALVRFPYVKILDLLALRNQLINDVKKCKDCCNPKSPEDNSPILVSNDFLITYIFIPAILLSFPFLKIASLFNK